MLRHSPTIGLALTLLSGCGSYQPHVTGSRLEKGLVVVLPGIEGRGPLNQAICDGLNAGGVDCAIELYDWTSSLGPLVNLRSELRNRRVAGRVADRILVYRDAYPGRPVVLVGHSGGGAMAVWVAEHLTWSGKIDAVVLIAPSLSAEYPLDRAIANTRRGIVNFYSTHDWILLSTTITGTMDGEHASPAGRVGFLLEPAAIRAGQYDRLFQIGWDPRMALTGHMGGHLSSAAGSFVSSYVAPLVLAKNWDRALISRLTGESLLQQPATAPSSRPVSPPAPPRSAPASAARG